jgi:hypothetical protein
VPSNESDRYLMDLDDWKTNAALAVAGTLVGGPIGLATSIAFMYAKSAHKKNTALAHAPPDHRPLPVVIPPGAAGPIPPPREVHLAASAFMKSNPKIGTSKTVTVLGKTYTLRAETHPLASAGEHGGVAIYTKG